MYLRISAREKIPQTEIFVKIIKKDGTQTFSWPREVILLLHGGPGGNHTLYADIEKDLLEIADLVLIDLRGCGLSQKTDAKYCTLDEHIVDLEQILKVLEIEKPIIHGCSYGAIMTLGFSIKYSHIPKKIILSSCAPSGEFIKEARSSLDKKGTPCQIKIAELLWNGAFETQEQLISYYKIMAPLYFCKEQDYKNSTVTIPNIHYNIELVNLAFKTFLRTFDFSRQLHQVCADTLIFSGKTDWIFNTNQAIELHKGIPNSTLASVDRCGHFPWKDQREIFLSLIDSFLFQSS